MADVYKRQVFGGGKARFLAQLTLGGFQWVLPLFQLAGRNLDQLPVDVYKRQSLPCAAAHTKR